jgi:hypothetical protein
MVITHKELTSVLKERIGMSDEDAVKTAQEVLARFGFNTYIVDNVLEAAAHEGGERDMFYMLEEKGILGTDREEITLHTGKPWRIFYWFVRTDWKEPTSKPVENLINQSEYAPIEKLYNKDIPEDAWKQHAVVEAQAIAL